MRIYVAAPYTADHARAVLENVNKAIDAGIEIMKKGHTPFIPHLSHYMHLRPHCPFEYEEYIKADSEWLKVSNAILLLDGWQGSNGALRELAEARTIGLIVYYSLDEIPEGREET